MSGDEGKHVFVSYVHEDSVEVDQLCAVLEAAQIPYWRDRKSLGPGDAWKAKIRDAIRDGSLVFLACFSDNSRAKEKSHMNEELTLAVEEYRKRPPGRTWLIPVRFDGGDVPDWDLGAGRTLSDLNYSDLFGSRYAPEAASLVTTIHGVMGDKKLSPAAALEAVDQATDVDRVDLLRRLTKQMLVDSARRIELDDLVSQEVQRVLAAINDPAGLVPAFGGTNDEMTIQLADAAQRLWMVTAPFCATITVAARWGSPEALVPWSNGIRSLIQAALKVQSGSTALLALRHLPGMVSLFTAGLAAASSRQWENLRVLVVEPNVRDRSGAAQQALLEATHPWAPFDGEQWTANTLARAVSEGRPFAEVLADMRGGRSPMYRSPVAEWMFAQLRPLFVDQWPDGDAYALEFDRAEVVLGALAQDAVNARVASVSDGRAWDRSRWYGRSTWRAAHGHGNPIEDLHGELTREGERWGPLRSGLFGADVAKAAAALDKYSQTFDKIANESF